MIALAPDVVTLRNLAVTCPPSSVITNLALDCFCPRVLRVRIKYAQLVDISSLPKQLISWKMSKFLTKIHLTELRNLV